jgi:hypothetical protein
VEIASEENEKGSGRERKREVPVKSSNVDPQLRVLHSDIAGNLCGVIRASYSLSDIYTDATHTRRTGRENERVR